MFGTFTGMNNPNDSSTETVIKTAPVENTGESVEETTQTDSEAVENVEADTAAETTSENDTSEDTEAKADDSDEDTETETAKKPKKGFERRIERFNQKLSAKDQEIEYWKKAAMGGTQSEVQPVQTAPQGKPSFADFNDIESYTEALTDWKVSQALNNMTQTRQRETVIKSYDQRLTEFKKETPDFQETLDEFVEDYGDKVIPEVVQIAMESEVGPAIAYYLAKNTDEVDRIALLPPHRRLIELGKLEDRLSKPKETVKEVPKVETKVSKASPPIESVRGKGKVETNDIYADLPYEQWVKLRTKKK